MLNFFLKQKLQRFPTFNVTLKISPREEISGKREQQKIKKLPTNPTTLFYRLRF